MARYRSNRDCLSLRPVRACARANCREDAMDQPKEPMTPDAIRALVERVTRAPGYTSSVGTRVESAEAGHVVMSLARNDNLLQINGFFHGGVIAGLADHAGGGAVTTAMPSGRFA